jgi:O-antigen/teichoic acid export membrane protein
MAMTLYLVVWTRHGAVGLLAARTLGVIAALALAAALSMPLVRAGWQWSFVRETLPVSLPLVLHGLMAVGLVAIDRFILISYRPLSEVGLYSLACNIGMLMTLVTASLSRAWTPVFFSMQRQDSEGRKQAAHIFADLVLIVSTIASVGALLVPHFLRWFVDRRYSAAGGVAPIILGAYLCHSLFTLFQLSVMQAKRTHLVAVVSAAALVCNIALNYAFIPRYGMYGAAYATLIAYALELVLMAAIAERVFPMPYGWLRASAAMIVFSAALACSQFKISSTSSFVFAGVLIGTAAVIGYASLQRDVVQDAPELLRS